MCGGGCGCGFEKEREGEGEGQRERGTLQSRPEAGPFFPEVGLFRFEVANFFVLVRV